MKKTRYSMILIGSILLLLMSPILSQGQERERKTETYNSQSMGVILEDYFVAENSIDYSSPAIADLDGDGHLEIVFGSKDNNVYCLTHYFSKKWNFSTGDYVKSSPALADINRDGKLEVIIGSVDKNVYCLNYLGQKIWNYTSEGRITSSPAIADLDGDGFQEIIVGSGGGNKTYCLDSNGNLKWSFTTNGPIVFSSPTIADLDNNGDFEIIIGSQDHNVYCLTNQGNLIWQYATGDIIRSSPAVADLNRDGKLEVIIGSYDNNTYYLDYNGNLLDVFITGGNVDSSPLVADIDYDGTLEIVIASWDGLIYYLNSTNDNLVVENSLDLNTRIHHSPAVADLDKKPDRHLEVIVGTTNNKTYCLSANGSILWNFETEDEISSSPAIVDYDNDNLLEIVIGSKDGRLYGIGLTNIFESGPQQWLCFRGSIFHTGQMDTDSDYLDDVTERYYGTDPDTTLTDNDFLTDGFEVFYGTNPVVTDTDSDSYIDCVEINEGTDPNNASDFPESLPPDVDQDGLNAIEEEHYGTLDNNNDTDDDGIIDGKEVNGIENDYNTFSDIDGFFTTNPTSEDSDKDGICDSEEIFIGKDTYMTNPNFPDSDNDGRLDGYEVDHGYDPLNPFDMPVFTQQMKIYLEIGGTVLGSVVSILGIVKGIRELKKKKELKGSET